MVDISTKKHIVMFPSKIAAAAGSPHQWNIKLSADSDNGTLVTLGNYVSFDNFAAGSAPSKFVGTILDVGANGGWYILVEEADGAIILYNTPKSPYTNRELRDPKLFYNGKDEPVRGYELINYDIFEISEDGFSGTPVVGKTVSYSGGKYVVAS